MKYSAIGFDLDGTLYPDRSLNIRIIPFLLKEQRFLRVMNMARKQLRKTGEYGSDFYQTQARLMGEYLNEPPEKVREKIEREIYRGWEPHFKKIALFPHARETLEAFRKEGIKMGLLSDFPPETKLENLKISGYWETVLCSELIGRLKPDPVPFLELASKMGSAPECMLYVGNSVPYDVEGAHNAGMKTALITPRWKKQQGNFPGKLPGSFPGIADFVFHDYRQLRDYVLS